MSVKLFLLLLCLPVASFAQSGARSGDTEWYKNALIYSIDVKTFKDGDGDGMGDFRGLTEKIGYIASLGVNTIWLAPFQPSPLQDDGYDITDYYNVDPRLGTKADFLAFVDSCHARNLRVIIDLVLDHSSDKHPWFQQSAKSQHGYRDWYFWQPGRPKFADSGVAFPGVQKETWTYLAPANAWYFHRFYNFQPHLNFYLPAVRKTAAGIMQYWLNDGIDGFRVDAVPFMIEKPDPEKDTAYQLSAFVPKMHRIVAEKNKTAMLLGEANVAPSEVKRFSGRHGEGLQMMFNFYVNQFLFYGLASGNISLLRRSLLDTKSTVPSFQWVYFLRNHDEIDLGRLDSSQLHLAFSRFGPDKNMQIYSRGIRRRLAPMLGNSAAQIRLAYAMAASLPGAFMIRYGEELGMGDDLSMKERISVRTPMQWSPQGQAGFTTADTSFRPVITSGDFDYRKINVACESADSNSLLTWMRTLIRTRNNQPEIANGSWQIADSSNSAVLVLLYEYNGNRLLTIANTSGDSVSMDLEIKTAAGIHPKLIFGRSNYQIGEQGGLHIDIPAMGYAWIRL